MINKDGELIYNSLKNWIQINIWDWEWINYLTNFEYLKYNHLWPDLIWISDKRIFGIEHFYVDASKKNKKWNALKVENSREIKNNIIPNIEKDLKTQNISSKSYKFKSTLTYENLKNNIYSNFDEHYKKIHDYNKNITEKYGNAKSVEIIFFIEFDTLVSAYLEEWNFIKYIHPFNDISFLNYFTDKKNIKWIIFNTNDKNYYIQIQDKYILNNKNIFDLSNWTIEDFEMNQVTVWIRIG